MIAKNKISGIICEFNPLHNGHAALMRHIKQETDGSLVCVMSGNFVQRGETAALDKWSRARLALQNGADLVIELPLPWAMAGAEKFAYGGVSLLQALGCTDQLWFGSECGDADALSKIADYLLSDRFSSDIKPYLAAGLPFAVARGKAIEQTLGVEAGALNEKPNNILGIEYCKALLNLHADIAPHTIPRFSVAHDATAANGQFASASLIRRMSTEGADISPFVPPETAQCIQTLLDKKQYPASLSHLERGILGYLSTCPVEMLRQVPDVSEGIENRICAAAGTVSTLEELYDTVKTKRYSHAHIRRIVLSAYLALTKDLPEAPPYIRVLGMTDTGAEIVKNTAPLLPFVMRPADVKKLSAEAQRIFELESRADDLYALCTEIRRQAKLDYTEKLIRL